MDVVSRGTVKVYSVGTGTSISEVVDIQKDAHGKTKLSDEERRKIELFTEFEFPTAANKLRMSNDGRYVAAVGEYKPSVRIYDVEELSLKTERHFDHKITDFTFLGDDGYRKFAFLRGDRVLDVHSPNGTYYKTEIPHFGRQMVYNPFNCDLYMTSASKNVYRINLEQGQFLAPFETSVSEGGMGNNTININPVHQLVAVGSEEGVVEFWDPRARECQGKLDVAASFRAASDIPLGNVIPEVSAFSFKSDGLSFAVGSSTGQVLTYDLRSGAPMSSRDLHNETAVVHLSYHSSGNTENSIDGGDMLYAGDTKALRLLSGPGGKKIHTTIEAPADINSVLPVPGSGLILMGLEQPRMAAFYVPSVGPAPKWCSFLDSLAEDLEESAVGAGHDEYKFVTEAEIRTLGLASLLGTELLKPYMHGFFMDIRLYQKAHAASDPAAEEAYRKAKVREEIEKSRGRRITLAKDVAGINAQLKMRLAKEQQEGAERGASAKDKEKAAIGTTLLADNRFSALFTDEAMAQDEKSQEYLHVRPVEKGGEDSGPESDGEEDGSKSTTKRKKAVVPVVRPTAAEVDNMAERLSMASGNGSFDDDQEELDAVEEARDLFKGSYNADARRLRDMTAGAGGKGSRRRRAQEERISASVKVSKVDRGKRQEDRARRHADMVEKRVKDFKNKEKEYAAARSGKLVEGSENIGLETTSFSKKERKRRNQTMGSRARGDERRSAVSRTGNMDVTFMDEPSKTKDSKKKKRKRKSSSGAAGGDEPSAKRTMDF